MNDINIGKKIADIRKSKNMTIKELSERANVTASMLSQLERGLANPSINTLKTIAQALEIQLFTFFIEDEVKDNLVVKPQDRKQMILPSEGQELITYELLSPDLKGDVELAIMTLTPKSHTSKDNFKHTGEEVAYVSKGKVHLFLNETELELDEGDSVKIPPNMLHRWYNPYSQEAIVIFAVSPPSF
ncbi:helix-turn-helix domain-containing protein [Acidaminobacter sp. JC074]|uniref:helix-turn-helix domain-containing protein n=1 Tax=Acidaminobacter sp. JC074 TaxID=2530199 RepID=UPI001F0E82E4|nr:helix-turn-helix domain-containing protein [Acidaminobacter sp. JC074]MCH4890373.1 helix-turn-helix domain-containing protein [Acidaminobacter sp. JC074]